MLEACNVTVFTVTQVDDVTTFAFKTSPRSKIYRYGRKTHRTQLGAPSNEFLNLPGLCSIQRVDVHRCICVYVYFI
jgi:hypothetical protein